METLTQRPKLKWKIDSSHSEIGFATHSLFAKVKGSFPHFGAAIYEQDNESIPNNVDFWIATDFINTLNEKRDNYLKGPDFFDSRNYPLIGFQGKSLKQSGSSEMFILEGDLTIKNITHPVKLNVDFVGGMKDTGKDNHVGFYLKGKLKRKDWALSWNNNFLDSGGVLVSDEIRIMAKCQLIREHL